MQLSYSPTPASQKRAVQGAFLIGFAASGFFDGILLHQILQWHHLLSSLTVGILGSIRGQVIFDGLFHAVMYVVAAVGFVLLYRARTGLLEFSQYRRLQGYFWIGFGVWHFVDAIVSHWITGIHRVRMDVSNPLLWDLGWLLAFGVGPILFARWLLTRTVRDASADGRRFLMWAWLTVAAGLWNAFPPNGIQPDTVTVVLRPDRNAVDIVRVLADTDARILWSDAAGAVWVLRGDPARLREINFYENGALFVSSSLGGAACGTWFAT